MEDDILDGKETDFDLGIKIQVGNYLSRREKSIVLALKSLNHPEERECMGGRILS